MSNTIRRQKQESRSTRYAKAPDGTSIAYQVVGNGPIDFVCAARDLVNVDAMWGEPRMAFGHMPLPA